MAQEGTTGQEKGEEQDRGKHPGTVVCSVVQIIFTSHPLMSDLVMNLFWPIECKLKARGSSEPVFLLDALGASNYATGKSFPKCY